MLKCKLKNHFLLNLFYLGGFAAIEILTKIGTLTVFVLKNEFNNFFRMSGENSFLVLVLYSTLLSPIAGLFPK